MQIRQRHSTGELRILTGRLFNPDMCVPPNEKAFRIQMMQCTTPPLVVGVHPLLLTLDGIHYVSTGKNITVLPPPTLESLHPTRGYFSGGTEVLIDGQIAAIRVHLERTLSFRN